MIEEKECKCEYPFDECENICICSPRYIKVNIQNEGIYFICPKCNEKYEERLERIRQNYRAQFGDNWH